MSSAVSKVFSINIEKQTVANNRFRDVIHTTPQLQIALMSLNKGEIIPMEQHQNRTQFIRVESGKAAVTVGDEKLTLSDGDIVVIPADTDHEVRQLGDEPLKLYSIYAPPEHEDGKRDERQPGKPTAKKARSSDSKENDTSGN